MDGLERLRSMECYDPGTDEWTIMPPMREVRSDACAVTFKGKIYVIGGFTGQDILRSVEVFDPTTMEWTYANPLNTGRSGVKATVYEDKIFVMGGYDGEQRLNSVETYSPSPIGRISEWKTVQSMPTRRSNFATCVVDGKIYVMGGYDGDGVISRTESFSSEEQKWTVEPPMNIERSALSAVAISYIPNARFYVKKSKKSKITNKTKA